MPGNKMGFCLLYVTPCSALSSVNDTIEINNDCEIAKYSMGLRNKQLRQPFEKKEVGML